MSASVWSLSVAATIAIATVRGRLQPKDSARSERRRICGNVSNSRKGAAPSSECKKVNGTKVASKMGNEGRRQIKMQFVALVVSSPT